MLIICQASILQKTRAVLRSVSESEPLFDMILGIHVVNWEPKVRVEEYQQKLAPLTKQDVQYYLEYKFLQFFG